MKDKLLSKIPQIAPMSWLVLAIYFFSVYWGMFIKMYYQK